MRDHHAVAHELAKQWQHLLDRRRLANHLGRYGRQPGDEARDDAAMRPHELREGVGEPLTNHSVGADFDDGARAGASAGGFEIDDGEFRLVESDAQPIALREPPLRRIGVEDEIRIGANQLANEPRAEFRIGAGAAQQQADELARVGARRPRA